MTKLIIRNAQNANVEFTNGELRTIVVNGVRELLPGDPHAVAKILRERRNKSPSAAAKARMAASARKRGL